MSYHSFRDEEGEHGSFEVFFCEGKNDPYNPELGRGWYWWACFPGCMPDGEASGPYKTQKEAIDDAQEAE